MAQARVRMNLGHSGANLSTIGRELRDMTDAKVTGLFRKRLEDAAAPFVPLVRASALAIPTTGEKHTGLRARIAGCAEVASWEAGRAAHVAVEINPARMPAGEMGLPLYMEGVVGPGRINHARWRHPVYGRWLPNQPNQPSHPYFHRAADGFGPAARNALEKALGDITGQISG